MNLRRGLAAALLVLAVSGVQASPPPRPSLAYDMSFAWHVAEVLTQELWKQADLDSLKLEPDAVHQFRFEFELMYVQALTQCGGGPLDELAELLRDVVLPEEPERKVALVRSLFAQRAEQLWAPIRQWDRQARPQVLLRHARDSWSIPWPACIHEGVRAQDPVLNALPRP